MTTPKLHPDLTRPKDLLDLELLREVGLLPADVEAPLDRANNERRRRKELAVAFVP